FADQLQEFIADMVAERIIDALELIKVETQHRQALATLHALDFVIELLQQQYAIGKVGQRVVARHMRDAVFGALALGYVLMGGQPAAARDRLVHDLKKTAPRRSHPLILSLSLS